MADKGTSKHIFAVKTSIEATCETLNKHLSENGLTLVIITAIKLIVAKFLGGVVSPDSVRYHSS